MKLQNLHKSLITGAVLAMVAASASALEVKAKKPARVGTKADLIVYLVDENYFPGTDKYRVTIRNIGKAPSGSAVLSAKNMAPGGGYGEASIPSMAPNAVKNVDIKLNKAPRKGDRIKFVADAKKHVDESNENNNVKIVNY